MRNISFNEKNNTNNIYIKKILKNIHKIIECYTKKNVNNNNFNELQKSKNLLLDKLIQKEIIIMDYCCAKKLYIHIWPTFCCFPAMQDQLKECNVKGRDATLKLPMHSKQVGISYVKPLDVLCKFRD